MPGGTLTIDLSAIVQNWRALDAMTECETGAVVKAGAYGLDATRVAPRLAEAGARQFFVATAREGVTLRRALGPRVSIYILSGHMDGDSDAIRGADLIPALNSIDQMLRHVEALPGQPFALQLDTGMNRLGMEPGEWSALRDIALAQRPSLIMSHLACADMPNHDMNRRQLNEFSDMTDGVDVPLSLAATGGILLGESFHYDLTRPGVGLYGGAPFVDAAPVVTLDLPVIQIRAVNPGETVGYANAWTATRTSKVATVSAGYADGLIRAIGASARLWDGNTAVPIIGRVSMDLITVDVTDLPHHPATLQVLGKSQAIDDLAHAAGTIGYEILTSLGDRYERVYLT